MGRTSEAERFLTEHLESCPVPEEYDAPSVYQPVAVHGADEVPRPGRVTGWWTSPDGVSACRLRIAGTAKAHWVVFDPDRIVLLVRGGT